jgi:hypothetical protein
MSDLAEEAGAKVTLATQLVRSPTQSRPREEDIAQEHAAIGSSAGTSTSLLAPSESTPPELRLRTDQELVEEYGKLDALDATQLTHAAKSVVRAGLDNAQGRQTYIVIGEIHGKKSSNQAVLATLAEVHQRGLHATVLVESEGGPKEKWRAWYIDPIEQGLPRDSSPSAHLDFAKKLDGKLSTPDFPLAATWGRAVTLFVADRLGFEIDGFDNSRELIDRVEHFGGDEREDEMVASITESAAARPDHVVIVVAGAAHVKALHNGLGPKGNVVPMTVGFGNTRTGRTSDDQWLRARGSYNLCHPQVTNLRPESSVDEQRMPFLEFARELDIELVRPETH